MKSMKNVFGKGKKKSKSKDLLIQYTQFLEKRVVSLEKRLSELKIDQAKLEESIKNTPLSTESQNHSEELKQENSEELDDTETILPGEELEDFNDEEYLILPKPPQARKKSIDILEKEAVKEVSTNRREIIKKKIIDELKKQELSAKELKILFVDEYQYCSKATFYRYLESLRKEQRIDSIKINGKEYLCSIPSKINEPTF